jgi:asparagine synthase (glutamine-hydrolysing)
LARSVTAIAPDQWTRLLSALPGRRSAEIGDKIYKAASLLGQRDLSALYLQLVTHWNPAAVAPGAPETCGVLFDERIAGEFPEMLARMQFLDLVTYLPDDILTKVDRASMAVALEARVPLIDHRVVEFAWQLPQRMKIRRGQSKWALRQILDRHVPRAIMERPKMGFGLPLGHWLR